MSPDETAVAADLLRERGFHAQADALDALALGRLPPEFPHPGDVFEAGKIRLPTHPPWGSTSRGSSGPPHAKSGEGVAPIPDPHPPAPRLSDPGRTSGLPRPRPEDAPGPSPDRGGLEQGKPPGQPSAFRPVREAVSLPVRRRRTPPKGSGLTEGKTRSGAN